MIIQKEKTMIKNRRFHKILSKVKRCLRPCQWKLMRIKGYQKLSLFLLYKYHVKKDVDQAAFRDMKTFCMFLGFPRSGHSIVGSLLDAHPNIVISDELDVLRYIKLGFSNMQICQLILSRSRIQAQAGRKKTGRRGKDYSYMVPGQWQGQYEKIRVIGDKKGGAAIIQLMSEPDLLQQLQQTIDSEIKFVVITRNPYDNISTMHLRQNRNLEYNKAIEEPNSV